MISPPDTVVVVPCYNEAARLVPDAFLELLRTEGRALVFVDDGSSDSTYDILRALRAQAPSRIEIVRLASNAGKAEAVRRGLLFALDRGVQALGYYDADLATPIDEMDRLLDIFATSTTFDAVLGARVALAGRDINRSARRHYQGRLFSTAGSFVVGARIYDTQCGAKMFRNTEAFRRSLAAPFSSRWAFDIELLGRMIRHHRAATNGAALRIVEVPLNAWYDIAGSKLTTGMALRAGCDLARIRWALRHTESKSPTSVVYDLTDRAVETAVDPVPSRPPSPAVSSGHSLSA
jgi:dolichyl-phosphate beta-glucosyltransferase